MTDRTMLRLLGLAIAILACSAACEPVTERAPGALPSMSPTASRTSPHSPDASPDGGRRAGRHRDERPDSLQPQPGRPAVVIGAIDGDTIEVEVRGRALTIRLIGIDTPETLHPFEPVGCYGPESSLFTEQRLDGEHVGLEFDVERLDPYGRTLAYVWTGSRLFNRVLVARGFATVSTYPPNVRYVDRFLSAQRAARQSERGIWDACLGSRASESTGRGGRRCDSSYPDVCIPPPPPDLDCADVQYRRFRVIGSDPHGFDGWDNDGIGCETG